MQEGGSLKQIINNIGWMLFDKVFIMILNLIITVRIANHYGSLVYGTYQYAVSVVALFEILVTFVDSRVVKKKYIYNMAEDVVINASCARLLFSFLSLIGGIIYIILGKESKDYDLIFIFFLFNAIIINLRFGMQNRYEYLLKSKKVIVASNTALIIGGILQLLAVRFQQPILMIAVITAISSTICFLIVLLQYKHDFGSILKGRINKKLIRDLIRESLPFAIAASCSIIYSKCDSVMIGNLLTKKEVGIYDIAVKLIAVVQITISPIRESVYPKLIELYRTNKKEYEQRYVQITAILTWLYIVGVFISLFILPFAFRFLDSDYARSFSIYKIYVLGTFFMYNAGLRAGHYTLINRGNILMYSQVFSVGVNIIMNYIFINGMGIYGAAIATVITQGLSLLVSNFFFGDAGREVLLWQIKGMNPLNILKKGAAG